MCLKFLFVCFGLKKFSFVKSRLACYCLSVVRSFASRLFVRLCLVFLFVWSNVSVRVVW